MWISASEDPHSNGPSLEPAPSKPGFTQPAWMAGMTRTAPFDSRKPGEASPVNPHEFLEYLC
jgi:hypothetical protein